MNVQFSDFFDSIQSRLKKCPIEERKTENYCFKPDEVPKVKQLFAELIAHAESYENGAVSIWPFSQGKTGGVEGQNHSPTFSALSLFSLPRHHQVQHSISCGARAEDFRECLPPNCIVDCWEQIGYGKPRAIAFTPDFDPKALMQKPEPLSQPNFHLIAASTFVGMAALLKTAQLGERLMGMLRDTPDDPLLLEKFFAGALITALAASVAYSQLYLNQLET